MIESYRLRPGDPEAWRLYPWLETAALRLLDDPARETSYGMSLRRMFVEDTGLFYLILEDGRPVGHLVAWRTTSDRNGTRCIHLDQVSKSTESTVTEAVSAILRDVVGIARKEGIPLVQAWNHWPTERATEYVHEQMGFPAKPVSTVYEYEVNDAFDPPILHS